MSLIQKPDNDLFDCAYNMMLTGQFSESYAMLVKLEKNEKKIPLLFNTAICLFHAESYLEAGLLFEQCLQLLKTEKFCEQTCKNNNYEKLLLLEKNNSSYLMPLPYNISNLNKSYINDRIIRCCADCYANAEMWDKFKETIKSILHKNYTNITNSLNKLNKRSTP